MHKEPDVIITVSIPAHLLKNIEQNIEGVSTNDKIIKCVLAGYAILTPQQK